MRFDAPLISSVFVVVAVRLLTIPLGFWTAEELRLAQSLLTFEGNGAPLHVALARLTHFFVRDPFAALVTLSVLASAAAAAAIVQTGRIVLGSSWTGVGVALFVLLSPAMLVFGPLPSAEALTIAFLAAAFLFLAMGRPELFALAAAAAIGVWPRLAPAMLVVVAIGCAVLPRRLRAMTTFGAALAVLFLPIARMPAWPTLDLSLDPGSLLRFTAHPWGAKFLSLPLLSLVAVGAALVVWRARRFALWRDAEARSAVDHARPPLVAMLAFTAVHVGFCIVAADPDEGVQPVIPAVLTMGFLAASAVARWPVSVAVAGSLYAAASIAYTWPLLRERNRHEAPGVMAMEHVRRSLPPGAIIVADPDLVPLAHLAGGRPEIITPERFDEIARRGHPELYLLMHGRSEAPDARVFAWSDSDAYGKLTTEKYRVVSLVPQPRARRYIGAAGVYAHESSPERGEWRWLQGDAVIELAPVAPRVALRFRLPEDAPIDSNRLLVGGTTVELPRGRSVEVIVPSSTTLAVRCERTFHPRDGRHLAVQLIGVEQR